MTKIDYQHSLGDHNMRAPSEVIPLIISLLRPASVVDVGCGLGTWLRGFTDCGIRDILGLDNPDIDRNLLFIEEEHFLGLDLRQPFQLDRTFDLVLCLEVAEHLPAESADNLVENLCNLGDSVVFSAAIPGQGGQNHINEQWPTYWIEKFAARGLEVYDVLRPQIWFNSRVNVWYRQNMLLFSREKIDLQFPPILEKVHPEMFRKCLLDYSQAYDDVTNGRIGFRLALAIFFKCIRFRLFK